MAYIFKETELPSLISVVPGRERIFFVNQELANIDDMLAGVMHYKTGRRVSAPPAQELRALLFYHQRQGDGGIRRRGSSGRPR